MSQIQTTQLSCLATVSLRIDLPLAYTQRRKVE